MNGTEKLIFSSDEIKIVVREVEAVMHRGETSLMNKLAEIVTKNGVDILELGFGMHLSADEIQSNPNVTSHTIIEVHPEIYKKLEEGMTQTNVLDDFDVTGRKPNANGGLNYLTGF